MLSIGAALLLLLALCACDNSPAATVITKDQVNQPTTTTTTTAASTTTTAVGSAVTPSADGSTAATTASTAPTARPSIGTGEGNSQTGDAIANTAIGLLGLPFQAGGNGPDGFDNPGLVRYCYGQNGHTLSERTSAQIAEYGLDVNPEEIQPGDILVFCNELGGTAGFVGIYIGENRFVACTNPASGVKLLELNSDYWSQRFISARRFS